MATLLQMPKVAQCAATACSFNDGGCHAPAVTIAAFDGGASCATFVESTTRGGVADLTATVGSCSRSDCTFNEALTCHASSVTIGQGDTVSDCLTYLAG